MNWHNLFKKKTPALRPQILKDNILYVPAQGTYLPLDQVSDPAFASKSMGDGFAIIPEGKILYAPVSGEVAGTFPTGHALTLKSENGLEILIHVGIDTVELNGRGFEPIAQQGQQITAGDPLLRFDPTAIRKAGYDPTIMVIVMNPRDVHLTPLAEGSVQALDEAMQF